MTRRLSAFILALLWTGAALAHPEYLWPERPTLTDAQTARIDSLVARARAEYADLAADERRFWAFGLAAELAELGHCRRAEQALAGVVDPGSALGRVAIPAAADPDRACADRFITPLASARDASGRPVAHNLYTAGALWRRIGEHGKGAEAIARAEALYAADEARDPNAPWSCHGGNCLSPLWGVRLYTLRLYHGTPLHRQEMNRLAALALSHRAASDARRPAPFIGHQVFAELLFEAVNQGNDPLARTVAEQTTYRAASVPAMRMALLIRHGRVSEAMALWPQAGRAFPGGIEPAQIRENPSAFHPLRNRFREWMSFREAPERLSVLPTAWIEAGDPVRAREALATAVADLQAHPDQWNATHVARIRAAEAQLEPSSDPVAGLAARLSGDRLGRAFAFAELAAGLAAAGRERDARRALRRVSWRAIAHDATVRLPCRAAAGGQAAALMAVRIAAPSMQPLVAPGVDATAFDGASYQTFLCLLRYRQADAALAYAAAVRDPEHKLSLLTAMPLNGGVEEELRVRGRFAALALEHVRGHDLWDKYAVPSMAADFERLGDYAAVDQILRRVRDHEIRSRVYEALLRSYGRDRIQAGPRP